MKLPIFEGSWHLWEMQLSICRRGTSARGEWGRPPKEVFRRNFYFCMWGVRVENSYIDDWWWVSFFWPTHITNLDKFILSKFVCWIYHKMVIGQDGEIHQAWLKSVFGTFPTLLKAFLVAPLGLLQNSSNEDVPRVPQKMFKIRIFKFLEEPPRHPNRTWNLKPDSAWIYDLLGGGFIPIFCSFIFTPIPGEMI